MILKEGYKNRLIEQIEHDLDAKLKNSYSNMIEFFGGMHHVIESLVDEMVFTNDGPRLTVKENYDKEKDRISKARKRFASSIWEAWKISDKELNEIGYIKVSNLPVSLNLNGIKGEDYILNDSEIEQFTIGYQLTQEWFETIKNKSRVKDRREGSYGYIGMYPYIESYDLTIRKKYFQLDFKDNILYLIGQENYVHYAVASPDSLQSTSLFSDNDHFDSKFRKGVYKTDYDIKPIAVPIIKQEVENIQGRAFDAPYYPDEKGKRIVRFIFTNCLASYKKTNSFETFGTLTDICKILYPKKKTFSASDYEVAERELWNIRNWGISDYDESGRKEYMSIFDTMTIEPGIAKGKDNEEGESKTRYYNIKVGGALSKDIVAQQYQLIIMNVLNKLDNSVAKILYETLNKDRIYDQSKSDNKKGQTHIYQIMKLQMIARVSGGKKKAKEKYRLAFDEMINKSVFIEKYVEEEESFIITWLPFTEAEKADIITVKADYVIEEILDGVKIKKNIGYDNDVGI